jgi:hypothetical protein
MTLMNAMFASAGRKLTPTSDRKRSAKYGLHLPLNRQSEAYQRRGHRP